MKSQKLFSQQVFQEIIQEFDLSGVTAIDSKLKLIIGWAQRIQSGRLQQQNEISVATDFINEFFGEVLEYFYGDAYYWYLEKELKTHIDGQKPDGAIGFFHLDSAKDVVSGIIEVKPFGVNLDQKQKRSEDKRTPVEQAFLYANKFGERCKWVFVSNLSEIRLYRADDATKYESFQIESLVNEAELKRFIFLCSRTQLIRPVGKSPVERLLTEQVDYNRYTTIQDDGHIIDKIYFSLKRFEGLSYFDPNILANTKPFHLGKQQVWHYYECTLASAERDIYFFFSNIREEKGQMVIGEKLLTDAINSHVNDSEGKVRYIIQRFNELLVCTVHCYEDVDLVLEAFAESKTIGDSLNHELRDYAEQLRTCKIPKVREVYAKDSLLPSLNRFDFKRVLKTLYSWEGTPAYFTPESMYLHVFFGTNNFKTAYSICNQLAETTKKTNLYSFFLSQYNKKLLNNLLRGYYWLDDQEQILQEIKLVDLLNVISDLTIYDYDIRKVISDLLSDRYRHRAVEQVEELTESLTKVKASFDRGPNGNFPNYTEDLIYNTMPYFASITLNYLVGEHYTEHRNLCKKLINAFMLSYSINASYPGRLLGLNLFLFNLMVLDIDPSGLEAILERHQIESFDFLEADRATIIESILNYLRSRRSDQIYFSAVSSSEMDRAMLSHRFRAKYLDGFENILLVLARCKVAPEEGKQIFQEIRYFIEASDKIHGQRLNRLPKVIGNENLGRDYKARAAIVKAIFDKKTINRLRSVKIMVLYLLSNYPNELEHDAPTWNTYLELVTQDDSILYSLLPTYDSLWPAAKEQIQNLVTAKLDTEFKPELYLRALSHAIIKYDSRSDFNLLISWANKNKDKEPYKLYNGKPYIRSLSYINFLAVIHIQNIKLDPQVFDGLLDWERWALRPDLFETESFKVEWLYIFSGPHFHEFFSLFKYVKDALRQHVKHNPKSELADIYLRYYLE